MDMSLPRPAVLGGIESCSHFFEEEESIFIGEVSDPPHRSEESYQPVPVQRMRIGKLSALETLERRGCERLTPLARRVASRVEVEWVIVELFGLGEAVP